ncbi:unnamed protein product [Rotaria socialis]|uniref:LIM zinc-binding domain-containing protein n=2 Tax=Rotaria socialis TaxID=392032 RepID=A0A820W437_9BILA|nr:unnamed protein product [Rotaria socialis]CAF3501439.1 unnamed protein product [Rotaria socialis]CAF4246202.1 unnamed protein product [Rotaria socialis]CAF4511005.1 unnamed protein product [Rotaria socialis]
MASPPTTNGSVMSMNNPWPHKSSMGNLIEDSISATARCYTCDGLVYMVEKKKTTNHIYHNRCFRCRICKRALTESSLNEEGDDIYCANCYRKKQRGDCNSLEFQRAANDRAQYIYNKHRRDVPRTIEIPRLPTKPDFVRHPSLALRQLERKFLSNPESHINHNEISNGNIENHRQSTVTPSFSRLINVKPISSILSSMKDEPSPSLHFSPAFSLSPRQSLTTTYSQPNTFHELYKSQNDRRSSHPLVNSIDSVPFQSKLFNSHLPMTTSPKSESERKYSIVVDLNEENGHKDIDEKKSTYRVINMPTSSIRGRSKSAHRGVYRYKMK